MTRAPGLFAGIVGIAALAGCELNARPGAESLLTVFADPTPSEAAVMAMDQYDADNRFKGTMLLGTRDFAGETVYMQLFLDNAKDPDASVRAAAIRAIGNHGTPENADVLIAALSDEDRIVRIAAARALQRIHSERAIDPLIKIASEQGDSDPEIRALGADALGQYPQGRVVQSLIAYLNDPSLAVNTKARDSLRTLTGQDFGFDLRQWNDWYDQTDHLFSARAAYVYPVYSRDRKWYEYIPFVPKPPNEPEGSPAGFPPMSPR